MNLMRMEVLKFQALCRLESLLAHKSWRTKTKIAELCATRILHAKWATDWLKRELPRLPGPPWEQPSGATGCGPAEVLAPEAVDWPPWALDTLAEAARGLEPGAVPEGGALHIGIVKVGSAAWRRAALDFVEANINLELYGHVLVGSALDSRGRPVHRITADSLLAGLYLMWHLDRTAGWMLWECSSRGCPRRTVFTLSALQYALVQKGQGAYCSRPCQNREMQRRHSEVDKRRKGRSAPRGRESEAGPPAALRSRRMRKAVAQERPKAARTAGRGKRSAG
jgi:hypothetical protein